MSVAKTFRSTFKASDKAILHWFPGHMDKGLKQMQQRLKNVDCVIEVHDARIPLSGRNELFKHQLLGVKPHFLVLNKFDLTDMTMEKSVVKHLKEVERISNVIFTDCRTATGKGIDQIVPAIENVMSGAQRYNRAEMKELCMLVIGVPNVGKSSLINALRARFTKRGKGTSVGAVAGITRSVLTRVQVCYHPPMYIMDTPGILEPSVNNVDSAFRLALCASMQDHLVGPVNIADYLLFWFNKNNHFSYVEKLELDGPTDSILEVLVPLAARNKWYRRSIDLSGNHVLRPDHYRAAAEMLKIFRSGGFGKYMLDSDFFHGDQK